MRICEIHIEEFGGITDRHVVLDSGFNLLYGANESGKSTLCSFIKYIFYGFSGSDERAEKSSFKTGVSSGHVIIEDAGGVKYRIVRYNSDKTKEKLNVFRESDGGEFSAWRNLALTPGDFFLGVSEKLYTRSIYVSQAGGAALDGGSAEAVSNLLISGDEATNLSKAKSALDGYRKSLKLKRGRGGRIAEAEDKLSELKSSFERGAKTKEDLSEITADIKKLQSEKEQVSLQLEEIKKSLILAKNQKIRALIKTKDELSEAESSLRRMSDALTEKYTVNGFLPDDMYIRELSAAGNAAEAQKTSHEKLKSKITLITEQKMLTVPYGYEEYIDMGGAEAVKDKYKKQSTAKRRNQLFAIFCFILSVTSIASFFIPDSFGVQLERSMGFAVVSTALTLLFGVLYIRSAFKLYKLNKTLVINSKRPYSKAFDEFEAYDRLHGNDLRSLSDTLTESEDAADETERMLMEKLALWGKSTSREAEEEYYRYFDEKRELEEKGVELNTRKNYNLAMLSIYSEEEISGAKAATDEGLGEQIESHSEKNVTELEIKIENIKGTLSELEIRRAEMSGGGMSELDRISADIDGAKALLNKLCFSYKAAELAIEALGKAEGNIRYSVSPYLSETAGEYFSALTKKRYSGLLLDESMSLRFKDGESGTPIDSVYLSGGSADLAWICLRLALHKKLSESRPVPIILDECFVYFDDVRLKAMLKKLTDMAAKGGVQIILFSASSREKDILQKTVNTVKI